MNGVNLNRFQFEYDLTWMAFFQDYAGINYARYGGREDSDSETHMTKASLVKTMKSVLELHRSNSVQPESKFEPRINDVFTPKDISTMKKMMSKRKESCIHCHDVKNARLREKHVAGELKKSMVFTYPSPRNLGMIIDSDDQTLIDEILATSAAHSKLKKGDRIKTLANQRVLTFADMTRVLEIMPEKGELKVEVVRNGEPFSTTLPLQPGWKKSNDPKWRPSTNVVGPNSGFWANTLNQNQRKRLGIKDGEYGLKVVVTWGAWARKAGIRNGDIVVSLQGMKKTPAAKANIRDLQSHLQMNREWGDTVKLELIRNGKRIPITMNLPKGPTE